MLTHSLHYEPRTRIGSPLTLIKVFVSIAGLHFRAELVPQAMQLPLEGVEACHCRLKKPGLNDAHIDSKVVYISPGNRNVSS